MRDAIQNRPNDLIQVGFFAYPILNVLIGRNTAFEIGGEFFEKEIFNILPEELSILAEKGIAMEISSTFHRDKQDTVEIFAPGNKEDGWIQILKMTSKVYKEALENDKIMFSFGSDAHVLENAGDIFTPIMISRALKIPGKRIMHLKDFLDARE